MGVQMLYSTKEPTQCNENGRYLITRKVNVENLPSKSTKSAQVSDVTKIKATVERSAQEVHEAYLKKIAEIRAQRALEK